MDDKQVVEYKNIPSQEESPPPVSELLLTSIKNFVEELTNITENKNFKDYSSIVNRIDISKVKSYYKLINGFKTFFDHNTDALTQNNFDGLIDPKITYSSDNGSFSFDFYDVYQDAEQCEQEIIKDHLNHIWDLLSNGDKHPEEIYIDKIFSNLKSRLSPDMSRDEQIIKNVKDLFGDFQKQNLDVSKVIKAACKRARQTLNEQSNFDNQSKALVLIDAFEKIDINNFNMIDFMGLVSHASALFSEDESNPLDLLSSILSTNNLLPAEDPSSE